MESDANSFMELRTTNANHQPALLRHLQQEATVKKISLLEGKLTFRTQSNLRRVHQRRPDLQELIRTHHLMVIAFAITSFPVLCRSKSPQKAILTAHLSNKLPTSHQSKAKTWSLTVRFWSTTSTSASKNTRRRFQSTRRSSLESKSQLSMELSRSRTWRSLSKKAELCNQIFNTWTTIQRVPQEWNASQTSLVGISCLMNQKLRLKTTTTAMQTNMNSSWIISQVNQMRDVRATTNKRMVLTTKSHKWQLIQFNRQLLWQWMVEILSNKTSFWCIITLNSLLMVKLSQVTINK